MCHDSQYCKGPSFADELSVHEPTDVAGKGNATPSSPATETPDLGRNGAPGRPSYMHLVEAEFKRRCDAGRLEPSLTKEAAALAEWFQSAYPDVRPYTAKAIYNKLGSSYRAAKSSPRTP